MKEEGEKYLWRHCIHGNQYGDVITVVTRIKHGLCPVYIAGRVVTAANEWGARDGLETRAGGVRGGWAHCGCHETTYKNLWSPCW